MGEDPLCRQWANDQVTKAERQVCEDGAVTSGTPCEPPIPPGECGGCAGAESQPEFSGVQMRAILDFTAAKQENLGLEPHVVGEMVLKIKSQFGETDAIVYSRNDAKQIIDAFMKLLVEAMMLVLEKSHGEAKGETSAKRLASNA